MGFLKKFKKVIDVIFDKTEEVKEVVDKVEEKIEVVQEVIQKTSDVIEDFEVHHEKLEKYIELFIDAVLWKYTTSGKAVDLFSKGFTKILNAIYKGVARKVKDDLKTNIPSEHPDDDTHYMNGLAHKAVYSKKMSQYMRRRILAHIVEKLTPDIIEQRVIEVLNKSE